MVASFNKMKDPFSITILNQEHNVINSTILSYILLYPYEDEDFYPQSEYDDRWRKRAFMQT